MHNNGPMNSSLYSQVLKVTEQISDYIYIYSDIKLDIKTINIYLIKFTEVDDQIDFNFKIIQTHFINITLLQYICHTNVNFKFKFSHAKTW